MRSSQPLTLACIWSNSGEQAKIFTILRRAGWRGSLGHIDGKLHRLFTGSKHGLMGCRHGRLASTFAPRHTCWRRATALAAATSRACSLTRSSHLRRRCGPSGSMLPLHLTSHLSCATCHSSSSRLSADAGGSLLVRGHGRQHARLMACALELTAEKQPCPRKRTLFFCGFHPSQCQPSPPPTPPTLPARGRQWLGLLGRGSRLGPDTETGGTVSTANTPNPAGPREAMVGATGSRLGPPFTMQHTSPTPLVWHQTSSGS